MIYEEIFGMNMTKLDNYQNIQEGSDNFKFYTNENDVIDVVCLDKNIIGINSFWYRTDRDNNWSDICEQLIKGAANVNLLSENDIEKIDRLTVSSDGEIKNYTDTKEIRNILNSLIMEKTAYSTTHDTEYYSGKIHELKAYENENLVYIIKVYSEDNGNMISVNDVMYHYYDTPDFSSFIY